MTAQPELSAARDQVQQTRAHLFETLDELEAKFTEPAKAVARRLDVVQVVRDNPWPALAVAVGVGVAISTTGADRKAAAATVEGAKKAGAAAADGTRRAAAATAEAVRQTPQRAAGLAGIVGAQLDGLVASMLLGFVEKLREGDKPAASSRAAQ
jgi:ElaB/YqjD/DUF883 family membrane-anchored ribosome-binding protein